MSNGELDNVALACQIGISQERISQLSQQLQRPIVAPDCTDYPFILVDNGKYLALKYCLLPTSKPVFVDFDTSRGPAYGHPLAKACGLVKYRQLQILDATAGLARDSFLLASWGADVISVEKSKILAILLADGLRRLEQSQAPVVTRLRLVHADAMALMTAADDALTPDVVYLDPMFPPRKKAALVKKEMQYLQGLLGSDSDSEILNLLNAALSCATKRVVLKRPIWAPVLAPKWLSHQIATATIRYEIYLSKLN